METQKIWILLGVILFFLIPFVSSSVVTLQTADTENLADSWLTCRTPGGADCSTNYGTAPEIKLGNATYSGNNYQDNQIYMFNLSSILSGKDIISAKLKLYVYNDLDNSEEGYNVSLHRIYQSFSWNETNITYNTAPVGGTDYNETADSDLYFFGGTGEPSGWQEWDATDSVKQEVADVSQNISLYLLGHDSFGTLAGVDTLRTPTKENSDTSLRPILEIEYAEYTLNDCGVVNDTGTWLINSNIAQTSSNHCINITSNDVIIDVNDNEIGFGNPTGGGVGIIGYSLSNVTIRNFKVKKTVTNGNANAIGIYDSEYIYLLNFNVTSRGTNSGNDGIYSYGNSHVWMENGVLDTEVDAISLYTPFEHNANNITLKDIKITTGYIGGEGVYLAGLTGGVLDNVTMINVTINTTDEASEGIFISSASTVQLINITIDTYDVNSEGIYAEDDAWNTLNLTMTNVHSTTHGPTASNFDPQALIVDSTGTDTYCYNSVFEGVLSDVEGVGGDVQLGGGYDYYFFNCSFSDTTGSTADIFQNWYVDITTLYQNSTPVNGANVTITNSSDGIVSSYLSDSNGLIPQQNLNQGVTPHTITVTKSGSPQNSTSYTIDSNKNITMYLDPTDDPPSISIIYPTATTYDYTITHSNISITDDGTLDTCLYTYDNYLSNTTFTCGTNITGLDTGEGTFTEKVWANDTNGNANSASVTFTVSYESPVITLDYPTDSLYLDSQTVYFNGTATDPNGVDSCQLYGNWTDTWHSNKTITPITSGVQFSTSQTINDGTYKYNLYCNDTSGTAGFNSTTNLTFTVDSTLPYIGSNNIGITTTQGSQTVNFSVSSYTELHCNQTFYSVYNLTGGIENSLENATMTCGNILDTFVVSDYNTYTLRVYMQDKAGNENYTDKNFTTSQIPATTTLSGGGSSSPSPSEQIPVIGIKEVYGSRVYNDLAREVFYARINDRCSELEGNGDTLSISDFSNNCKLSNADLDIILQDITDQGFTVFLQDLENFYQAYKSQDIFQGFETRSTIRSYLLFTSVLGIPNPMKINPQRLDRPFLFAKSDGNVTLSWIFTVNKNIRDCSVISETEELDCVMISNSSFRVDYFVEDTNFFSDIFSGKVSVTSDAEKEFLEVKDVTVIMRAYNFGKKYVGIPAWILLIGGSLISIIILVILVRIWKRRRKR